jgi:ABC-type multidrug transport system fused ATPase/permease subunit
MLVVAASTATITYLAKPIFDEALQQQVDRDFLFRLAAVLVFMYLVLGVARFLSTYMMGTVGFAVVRDLRTDLFRHLEMLPLDALSRRSGHERRPGGAGGADTCPRGPASRGFHLDRARSADVLR